MNGRHLTLAEIAAASGLPQDDPRRLHLAACTRCRTLHARHQQFIAPPTHLPAADLRDAEARLAELLASEIAPGDVVAHSTDRVRMRHEFMPKRGPSARFGAPALAIAATILVVGGVFIAQHTDRLGGRASGVLRGGAREGFNTELRQLAPVPLTAGRVELRWCSVASADRYEVSIFSPELRALAVLGTARETVVVLAPGSVAGAAAGDTLLWRVVALRGEVAVAQTGLGIVRLP